MSLQPLGRVATGRAGLGNELFPFARALLWARDNEGQLLRTRWFHLRFGPYLRREDDKRRYELLFSHDSELSCLRSLSVRLRRRVKSETEFGHSDPCRSIFIFKGPGHHFTPLYGENDYLKTALELATRTPPGTEWSGRRHIAVHVRLGDFAVSSEQGPSPGVRNRRLRMSWYVRTVAEIRRRLPDLPAVVYSDGEDRELVELLSLAGTVRAERNTALNHILCLSEASCLVASGSTFSAWGAYLGQVPVIWYKGQLHYPTRPPGPSEIEWSGETSLPRSFYGEIAARS